METRSNYVIVGGVAMALAVGILVMVVWLARFSRDDDQRFDIFFGQSIAGLNIGAAVAFNGVPVGKVEEIKLLPDTPQYVRVRISVQKDVPVLKGTSAVVDSVGFTGPVQVQLSGAMQGAERITEPGPYGVPIIPPKRGALGQLLANAPELLGNISRLAQRLGDTLDPANQKSIANILKNADRASGVLADQGPAIAAAIGDARTTLKAATTTLQRIEALADSTQTLLDNDGKPLAAELRGTLKAAANSLARFDELTAAARPGVETFSGQTLPEATQLLRELRETTASLGAIAAKLDEDPAGALVGGRKLPTYQPPASPKEPRP
ncbi:MlaD family protein [Sandarakinorhabdus sp.]|uniref:MlaD family protein n=1 Tax=Sandarakinorhabdus sp. TaxID=1916663 RepID=UPI00286E3F5B|nr:MlaD family protein [Sandarakinorhabdus sp.]